jgi:uncharacterized protein (TIGR02452 family)
MIACAFADFRAYIPIFVPYSESSNYFNILGYVIDQDDLEERLMMDMDGVLKTAVKNGVQVLVLGASGCGAFKHDVKIIYKLIAGFGI